MLVSLIALLMGSVGALADSSINGTVGSKSVNLSGGTIAGDTTINGFRGDDAFNIDVSRNTDDTKLSGLIGSHVIDLTATKTGVSANDGSNSTEIKISRRYGDQIISGRYFGQSLWFDVGSGDDSISYISGSVGDKLVDIQISTQRSTSEISGTIGGSKVKLEVENLSELQIEKSCALFLVLFLL